MNPHSLSNKMIRLTSIAGITSGLFYFVAVLLSCIPDRLQMFLGVFFPILMIIGFIGLYHFLKGETISLALEIAYLFGLFAGLIACSFIVIQQANIIWHQELISSTNNTNASTLYKSVNRVQLAMDVVFDIFISISIFFLGINIITTKKLIPAMGWIGCFLAFLLLILNLYTFPNPPSSQNVLDIGPFLGIWMLVIFTSIFIKVFKRS